MFFDVEKNHSIMIYSNEHLYICSVIKTEVNRRPRLCYTLHLILAGKLTLTSVLSCPPKQKYCGRVQQQHTRRDVRDVCAPDLIVPSLEWALVGLIWLAYYFTSDNMTIFCIRGHCLPKISGGLIQLLLLYKFITFFIYV